jgi:hypothetical protein
VSIPGSVFHRKNFPQILKSSPKLAEGPKPHVSAAPEFPEFKDLRQPLLPRLLSTLLTTPKKCLADIVYPG